MNITVLSSDPLKIKADVLVFGLFAFEKHPGLTGALKTIDRTLAGAVQAVLSDEDFHGKENEVTVVQAHGSPRSALAAKRILVIGLGAKNKYSTKTVCEVAALAVKQAKKMKSKSIVLAPLPSLGNSVASRQAMGEAIAEGVELASYQFVNYFSAKQQKEKLGAVVKDVTIMVSTKAEIVAVNTGVISGQSTAAGVMLARNQVNTPAADMTPQHLVESAQKIAAENKYIKVEIFDVAEMERRGMGALLAVAKGSVVPPAFIHLTYKPTVSAGHKAKKIFVVGKGITFDSGGLSLKPTKHMESMHGDMAGAAVVLGVFSTLGVLQPKVEVHGLIAAAENMPSGSAVKIHDIVKAMNGTTIEIMNTDAEGRLVLADALSFAVKQKASTIVDIATLTGSVVEALGPDIAGVFSNSAKLTESLKEAAVTTGESIWELPLVEAYEQFLKGKFADIKNAGTGIGAGSITGAMFLQHFVNDIPWAHLDIAGPFWQSKEPNSHTPTGATGFGVRLILQWLRGLR